MDKVKLQTLVAAFLTAAMDSVQIDNADGSAYLSFDEVLLMWTRLPDCQLTPMFIGYAMALGNDVNSFAPNDLELAVRTVLARDDEVGFDWLGDIDAESKPH